MATVTMHVGIDIADELGEAVLNNVTITIANPAQIQGTAGSYLVNLYGSFFYDAYGYLRAGTLTRLNEYAAGMKLFEITGLSLDIIRFATYDIDGLLEYTFAGKDTFNGSAYSDVLLDGYAGNDVMNGNGGNDILYGNIGNDILNGGTGNDFLNGGLGHDRLNGGEGVDTLIGGQGNDIYYVDSASDLIEESSTDPLEIDMVISTASRVLGMNLENLTLTGTAAINGLGNGLANTLTGNSGANRLNGAAGNDTLVGGMGDDILIGGTGADRMEGGLGNDIYYVDNPDDCVLETYTDPTGVDTVISSVSTRPLGTNLENLTLIGTAAINGVGNEQANTLIGNSGANTLNGGAGDDILIGGLGDDILAGNYGNDTLNGEGGNDILVGGMGIDTMRGGLGNDSYYVDNEGDVTLESSAVLSEIDTVISSVDRTLGANLENLTLDSSADLNGTGNALDNVLTGCYGAGILDGRAGNDSLVGNDGNDTLNGKTGNDLLSGGSGKDKLAGGAGKDLFLFDSPLDTATNIDTLVNFIAEDDGILLDQDIFTRLSSGMLSDEFFCCSVNGAAIDANDYLLYNTSSGALFYDADGSGSVAAIQFATLDTKPILTATDFAVVA